MRWEVRGIIAGQEQAFESVIYFFYSSGTTLKRKRRLYSRQQASKDGVSPRKFAKKSKMTGIWGIMSCNFYFAWEANIKAKNSNSPKLSFFVFYFRTTQMVQATFIPRSIFIHFSIKFMCLRTGFIPDFCCLLRVREIDFWPYLFRSNIITDKCYWQG